MAGKQLWLDAGLQALADAGARGVTIDKLAATLKLSKGSFYHHFAGMDGFKIALLEHFETVHTTRFIDAVERQVSASPRLKLQRLLDLVLREHPGPDQPDVEIAMRAWAQQDPDVRAAQQRVDGIRIRYLRGLWQALSGDDTDALAMGRLLYVVLIGAGHVIPPLQAGELRRLYELVLRLAPRRKTPVRVKAASARRTR